MTNAGSSRMSVCTSSRTKRMSAYISARVFVEHVPAATVALTAPAATRIVIRSPHVMEIHSTILPVEPPPWWQATWTAAA